MGRNNGMGGALFIVRKGAGPGETGMDSIQYILARRKGVDPFPDLAFGDINLDKCMVMRRHGYGTSEAERAPPSGRPSLPPSTSPPVEVDA